jgi:hypothetical protein
MVKKVEIAKKLGLHVATVSRILNEVPEYRASKETIKKVFDTAREMGYDFERQKRFYKRRHRRFSTEGQVKLQARMSDGKVLSHEARMVNMGEGGLLLADFHPKIVTLPLRDGDITIEVATGPLKGVKASCHVVRVGKHNSSFGICVQVKGLTKQDTDRIEDFVSENSPE